MAYNKFTLRKVVEDFSLQMEGLVVTIDLVDYSISPIDRVLSILLWMLRPTM